MRGTHSRGGEAWYQSGDRSGPADGGVVFSSEPTGDTGEGSVIGDSKEDLRLECVIPTPTHPPTNTHLQAPESQHLPGSLSECVDLESVDFS